MGCKAGKEEINDIDIENPDDEEDYDFGKKFKRTRKQFEDDKLRAKIENLSPKCEEDESNRDEKLYKLLLDKFSKKSENIKFSWVTPQEFNKVLSLNKSYFRLMNKLRDEKEDFLYQDEKELTFKNISPILVYDDKGEKQYYRGCFNQNGQCHGPGIWMRDKNIYFGNFKNDEFSGNGLYINKKGDYYLGYWENGKCNGGGKLYMNGIKIYEGGYKDNNKEGEGEECLPDGNKYEGRYENDERIGDGKYIFSDGSSYEGGFKDGKFDGEGTFTWKGGQKYNGSFLNGKINGHGTYEVDNDYKYEGNFVNNTKHGQGKITWGSGTTFECKWINNVPDPNKPGEFNEPISNQTESLICKNNELYKTEN